MKTTVRNHGELTRQPANYDSVNYYRGIGISNNRTLLIDRAAVKEMGISQSNGHKQS